MMSETLIEIGLKSVLVAGGAVLLLRLLGRRSASEKAFIANLALAALLLLPAAVAGLPDIRFETPVEAAQLSGRVEPEQLAGREAHVAPGTTTVRVGIAAVALIAWAAPATILLLAFGAALVRLTRIRARAEVVGDVRWLTAMAVVQQRLSLKHDAALLVSAEATSPVSWGVMRPVIVLDRATAALPDRAEAVLAHELAHVARYDWLALAAARVATALFWFNPLVWVLARASRQLCEEAADDAVLRARVSRTDYAELLVDAVRSAGRGSLAANAVAPGATAISRRVRHLLDPVCSRAPVRFGWAAASVIAIALTGGALAVARPTTAPYAPATDSSAGERAAEDLARREHPQVRALGAAIAARDWSIRRAASPTTFHDPEALQPLLRALRDDHPDVRRMAVWGLSEMRPTVGVRAAQPILALLADPDPAVRGEAAGALGDFGAVEAAPAIARLLGEPDASVRARAAHALGDLQQPGSRDALERARADPDASVRAKALWALAQIREADRRRRSSGG